MKYLFLCIASCFIIETHIYSSSHEKPMVKSFEQRLETEIPKQDRTAWFFLCKSRRNLSEILMTEMLIQWNKSKNNTFKKDFYFSNINSLKKNWLALPAFYRAQIITAFPGITAMYRKKAFTV